MHNSFVNADRFSCYDISKYLGLQWSTQNEALGFNNDKYRAQRSTKEVWRKASWIAESEKAPNTCKLE